MIDYIFLIVELKQLGQFLDCAMVGGEYIHTPRSTTCSRSGHETAATTTATAGVGYPPERFSCNPQSAGIKTPSARGWGGGFQRVTALNYRACYGAARTSKWPDVLFTSLCMMWTCSSLTGDHFYILFIRPYVLVRFVWKSLPSLMWFN